MKPWPSDAFCRSALQYAPDIGRLLERPTERYQYVPLRELPEFRESSGIQGGPSPRRAVQSVFTERSQNVSGSAQLVLDGGVPIQNALPGEIEFWPLFQARRLLGTSLQRRLDQASEQELDLMAQLAQRGAPEPLVLYVPPRTEVRSPMRVLINSSEDGWSLQRVIVIVGAQATCHIQIEQRSQAVVASSWELWQEEGSTVTLEQLDEASGQWAFTALRAELKRHARFCWRGASCGGRTVRWDIEVRLQQEGAETDLSGFWNLAASQVHSHVKVEHLAPACRSNQLFKGINDEGAVSSFEGLIHVQRVAQQTNAYQLNQNLLVHPSAKAFSKPSLDILADDVRATHGSTTGRLDPEQQFYLESRGVPRSQAKRLLTRAFGETLLRDLPNAWQARLIAS